MLGPPKSRDLDDPIRVSIETLVPPSRVYRHLVQTLELAFVRELGRETDAGIGRPSIDPVVVFKLQLILFFEGLRSERQLMRVVADRLSLRWYLGYDLSEVLSIIGAMPNHPDGPAFRSISSRPMSAPLSTRSARSPARWLMRPSSPKCSAASASENNPDCN